VTDSDTILLLRDEVIACRRLVVAPGIYDAEGTQMIDDDVIRAIAKHLVPEALLLMLRCKDAEKMLGMSIQTDDDMVEAARRFREMGAEWVLLRGGCHTKGRLTALLFGPKEGVRDFRALEVSKKEQGARNSQWCQFFTSYNTEGWQRHGVAGALSAAITVRLGMGDDVPAAIRNAHDFIHSQVVYAKDTDKKNPRSIDLYNAFVSLVAELYYEAHDVSFYAEKLCITRRYLSQITDNVVGKSPKQIIDDYLMSEAKSYLDTTRLTVQQIADKLGFSSQALFCKSFKNQTGTSPTEYRSHSHENG
jgi:hydroxymethylpyrimidine/phosphomethylpyrimidine kinase